MSQINRVPSGLQGLLGSKNFGDNPKQLAGIVAPTIDMWPFLSIESFSASMTSDFPLTAAIGDATFAQHFVPDGEIWLVGRLTTSVQANAGPAAGDQLDVSVSASRIVGSNSAVLEHPLAFIMRHVHVIDGFPQVNYGYELARLTPLVGGTLISFTASNVVITGVAQFLLDSVIWYYKLDV